MSSEENDILLDRFFFALLARVFFSPPPPPPLCEKDNRGEKVLMIGSTSASAQSFHCQLPRRALKPRHVRRTQTECAKIARVTQCCMEDADEGNNNNNVRALVVKSLLLPPNTHTHKKSVCMRVFFHQLCRTCGTPRTAFATAAVPTASKSISSEASSSMLKTSLAKATSFRREAPTSSAGFFFCTAEAPWECPWILMRWTRATRSLT